MKPFKIVEEDADRSPWEALEEGIRRACHVAYMLSCAVEERYHPNEEQAREQQEAVCFGVYELQAQVKEVKELYSELFEHVRTVRVARDEPVPLEEDEPDRRMKAVSVH